MDLDRKIEVLNSQIVDAQDGFPHDFEQWRATTAVALRTVMGADSPLLAEFKQVQYAPRVWYRGMDSSGFRPAGVKKAMAILRAAKVELALQEELGRDVEIEASSEGEMTEMNSGNVFIIHGHDDVRKLELFRLLDDLTGHKPLILNEQPNRGKGILEKLEEYAAAATYAVALLTADDLGQAKNAPDLKPRARQNVVFEAGYFAGLIGRSHVILLYEEGVELPSDLGGIAYVPLDATGAWKMKIAHELQSGGLTIDWAGLSGH